MIRTFFTIALRSLLRHKAVSLIHVIGLAVGISASVVIFLIVHYEFNFDQFQKEGDRIYRVVMDVKFNGMEGHSSAIPAPLAGAMQEEVTDIDAVVPVMGFPGDGNANVTPTGKDQAHTFKTQSDIIFTTQDYFKLIPFQWIAGSPAVAMKEPFSIVLTEQRSRLYFPLLPTNTIIGKQLTYNDITVTVTGIVHDLNETTDFTAREFISYSTIAKTNLQQNFMMNEWNDWMAYSKLYCKLSAANDKEKVTSQLNALLLKYGGSKDENNKWVFVLQPLADIHFNEIYTGFGQRIANKSTLYGLILVAAFLLLLACINFVNLATAQLSKRAKEIGIRKSIGSSRKQLVVQFLSETFYVTLAAAILSMALAPMLLELFTDFIPQGILFEPWKQPQLLLFLFALIVVVTLISGIYPALILSGLRPAAILKGIHITSTDGKTSLRKTLTVAQFMIAQIFVFGAFMITKQINYSITQDLGYSKDAIVYFDVPRSDQDHREQLLNELRAMPEVSLAALGFSPPAVAGASFGNIVYHRDGEEIKENVQIRWGDSHYLDLYHINVIAGRNVQNKEDLHEVVINETYAKTIGFINVADAVNHELLSNGEPYTIVGVMRDFHESSTRSKIGPLVFLNSSNGYVIHLALTPHSEQWPSALTKIGKAYKTLHPDREFKYNFFDTMIEGFYKNEQNTAQLLNWAMGLSILISCMGLLGLVMHTSDKRTKEIGIRKILGASVTNIIVLLSFDFVKLVSIAFIITVPISWWAADKWLESFAYRTAIDWWIFALSGFTLIIVALITISAQTIRTAVSNPVNSLRAE